MITAMLSMDTNGSNSDRGVKVAIYQDTTQLYDSGYDLYDSGYNGHRIFKVTLSHMLDLSSASETTIKIQFASTRTSADAVARINAYSDSNLIVQEIAG